MAEELLLSIEKLLYGGDGLAHAEGNTVFVPYVLPGEQVRAAVRTKKKKLIQTKLLEVTKSAAARIAPKCPHFGDAAGVTSSTLNSPSKGGSRRRFCGRRFLVWAE